MIYMCVPFLYTSPTCKIGCIEEKTYSGRKMSDTEVDFVNESERIYCCLSVLDNGLTSLKSQTLSRSFPIVNTVKKNSRVSEEISSET